MKIVSLVAAFGLMALPALAASGDMTTFDGTYLGRATPTSGGVNIGGVDACAAFDLGRVTIDHGTLHSEPGAPIVSGYVTPDGAIKATMTRGSMYGHMDGHLTAGIIDAGYADGKCTWSIELKPV